MHWKVWREHFLTLTSSFAPMRLSAYLLAVFSPSLPQQRRRLQALCASWSPDTPPLSVTSGKRDPGSRLGRGFQRKGQAKFDSSEERHPCQTSGWTVVRKRNNTGSKYVMRIDNIHRGPQTPTQVSHRDMVHSAYMCATVVLSGGCVVLQWGGSLGCEWKARL